MRGIFDFKKMKKSLLMVKIGYLRKHEGKIETIWFQLIATSSPVITMKYCY